MKGFLVSIAALTLASVSLAQAPSDVPQNHWAADSVANMFRLGMLKGYPDDQFRGSRPATRYEMAQGVWNLYRTQSTQFSDLQRQIDALKGRIPAHQVDVEALAAMRKQLDGLQSGVNQAQSLGPEIGQLQASFRQMTDQLRLLHQQMADLHRSLQGNGTKN